MKYQKVLNFKFHNSKLRYHVHVIAKMYNNWEHKLSRFIQNQNNEIQLPMKTFIMPIMAKYFLGVVRVRMSHTMYM